MIEISRESVLLKTAAMFNNQLEILRIYYDKHIEIKEKESHNYYYEIEMLEEMLVLGVCKEENRSTQIDLGRFDRHREIASDLDVRKFVDEVIEIVKSK